MTAAATIAFLAVLASVAAAQKLGLVVGNCFSHGSHAQWDVSSRIQSGSVCIATATASNSTGKPTPVTAAHCDDTDSRQVFHYKNSMFFSDSQVGYCLSMNTSTSLMMAPCHGVAEQQFERNPSDKHIATVTQTAACIAYTNTTYDYGLGLIGCESNPSDWDISGNTVSSNGLCWQGDPSMAKVSVAPCDGSDAQIFWWASGIQFNNSQTVCAVASGSNVHLGNCSSPDAYFAYNRGDGKIAHSYEQCAVIFRN